MPDITIMFVDDEVNILKTLQRLFLDEDYTVITAQSGQEALAKIDEGCRPAVVVSDQKMPGMAGVQFLQEVKARLPESIRIILTGYADISAAVDAINLGGIFRYILKPWEDEDLKLSIRDAVSRFQLVAENNRLTEGLRQANLQLEELNTNLEQRVQERTRELQQSYEENLQLTAELQTRIRELQAWDRIQTHLLTIHPLEETLQLIIDVVHEVSQADSVHILLNDDHGAFELAASNLSEEQKSIRQGEKTPKLWMQQLLQTVTVGQAPALLEGEKLGTLQQEMSCIVLAPILRSEKQLGLLLIARVEAGKKYDEEQLHILSNFAMQAGVAIQDSRMHFSLDELGNSLDQVLKDFGPLT